MADEKVIQALLGDGRPTFEERVGTVLGVDRRASLQETPMSEFLIGAGRRFTEMGQAGKQIGLSVAEKAGFVPEGTSQAYTNAVRAEAALYESTPVADSGWATAGSVMTDILVSLPALSVTAPLSASSLTLTGAARVGAIEGILRPAYSQKDTQLLNPERVLNVATNVFASVAAGAVASKIIPSAALTVQEKMASGPFNLVQKKALNDLEASALKEGVDAAKKLNMFITPGEASGDLLHKQIESSLMLFHKGKRELLDRVLKREESLQAQLTGIVRGLVPEGEAAAKTAAYDLAKAAYSAPVPSDLAVNLAKQSPIFKKALKAARSGTGSSDLLRRAGGIDKIAPNTVGELHLMRLYIDDLFQKATAGRGKFSTASLTADRKQLTAMADWFAPEYALSRNINQRLLIQREWQQILDTTKVTGRASDTFYKNFLSTPEKYNKLMEQVERITEPTVRKTMKENLEVMAVFLRKLNDSPLDEALGISTRELRATARGVGGVRGIALNAVSTIADGTLDKHVMRFITSPSWYDEFVKRTANASATQKNRVLLGMFYDYLARTAPGVASGLQTRAGTEALSK